MNVKGPTKSFSSTFRRAPKSELHSWKSLGAPPNSYLSHSPSVAVIAPSPMLGERSAPAQIFAQPKEARTRAFLERLLEREGRRD